MANKYNYNGSINVVWLYQQCLEDTRKNIELEVQSILEYYNYINYYCNDIEDKYEYIENSYSNKDYEAAFQFLKQHSTNKSDEEIALDVLNTLG